jgi:hypothetical protein
MNMKLEVVIVLFPTSIVQRTSISERCCGVTNTRWTVRTSCG